MDGCRAKDCMAILLVGRTRQGKSATRNSILQNRFFNSTSQAANNLESFNGFSTFRGRKIQVVDTPGLCKSQIDREEKHEKIVEAMSHAIALNPKGYHAIIVVINFSLFTNNSSSEEDLKVVNFLKNIFGSNFMQDRGILLFTGGDYFKYNKEVCEENLTFEMWLARQTDPYIQLLREECGSRAILFNNISRDKNVNERQVQQLIDMIDNLTDEKRANNSDALHTAEQESDRIMDKVRLNELSLIDRPMGHIEISSKQSEPTFTKLLTVQGAADSHLAGIQEEEKCSNSLTMPVEVAAYLQKAVIELLEQFTNQRNEVTKAICERDGEAEQTSDIVKEQEVELQYKDQHFALVESDEAIELPKSKEENQFPMILPLRIHASKTLVLEEDKNLESLIEDEEKVKRRIVLAKKAYGILQAQVANLEEERMRLKLESEEQRQLIEKAENNSRMLHQAQIEHNVLDKIIRYLQSIVYKHQ